MSRPVIKQNQFQLVIVRSMFSNAYIGRLALCGKEMFGSTARQPRKILRPPGGRDCTKVSVQIDDKEARRSKSFSNISLLQ